MARDGRVGGVAINFANRRAWFWVRLLLSSLRRKRFDLLIAVYNAKRGWVDD